MDSARLFQQVEALKPEMVNTLMQLIRVSAVGPESSGDGEDAKAAVLMRVLSEVGFDRVERYDVDDSRVSSGKRPNIVAYLDGETNSKRLWIVTHLDVVPSGEASHWKVTKPFEPTFQNGNVYGRGSEDNGQSLVASIFAAKALKQSGVGLNRSVALAFVADEEQGSTMGIQHLLSKGLFREADVVLVPDSGTPKGNFIEIAEKSILWFKVSAFGKQTHASIPSKGLNAHRIGMQIALKLDSKLHQKYNACNTCFSDLISTFEPTKKTKNVDAVNIVPGEDTFYFDCRILPQYAVEAVLADVCDIASEFEAETGAKIKIAVLQKQTAAPEVTSDSEGVMLLKEALRQARGFDAVVGGIGGGTCAAFFREKGISAVVWSTIDEVAHQPDEYSKVANMVEDAKVFALLALL
ncbi:MAG: M20 family metallo-hydrolase [Candidatus Bathyarchaeota archaeon]|nr:M20 family metallo-hydrolase [Candidatus Bathyarchaeota archaeon]